jgi:hypothetical protein
MSEEEQLLTTKIASAIRMAVNYSVAESRAQKLAKLLLQCRECLETCPDISEGSGAKCAIDQINNLLDT